MASTPIATVLNSTLTRSRKKLIMASIKSNALMAWALRTIALSLKMAVTRSRTR